MCVHPRPRANRRRLNWMFCVILCRLATLDNIEKTIEFQQQVDFLRGYKASMTQIWNFKASVEDRANGRPEVIATPG